MKAEKERLRVPESIRDAFPAYSYTIVLGGRKSSATSVNWVEHGDAWIIANDDGVRLAVSGRRRFIQMDALTTSRLIAALTKALTAYESRTDNDAA
jgi:hypothetical protein